MSAMRPKQGLAHLLTRYGRVPLVVLALLLGVGFFWLQSRDGLSALLGRDSVWERMQRDSVLRVGMDASFPPFEVEDAEGNFSGYDVDLAIALAQRWGLTPQFVNVHLDGLYDALEMDRFDVIISALPYDPMRTRDVRFSQSYFNAGQVLLVPEGREEVEALRDLGQGRVAVELGSEAHLLVRQAVRDQALPLSVATEREPEQVLEQLVAGEADALVCDRLTAFDYLRQTPGLRMVSPPLSEYPYVIAVRWEATELLSEINAALTEWRESGYLEELERRWF